MESFKISSVFNAIGKVAKLTAEYTARAAGVVVGAGIIVGASYVASKMAVDPNITSTLAKIAVPAGITAFGTVYLAAATWPLPQKAYHAIKSAFKPTGP